MNNWAAIVAATAGWPGTTLSTSCGRPAVKVRGKTIASLPGPDSTGFALHATLPEKEVLLATDPATFWKTDHYRGWPALLVRYGTGADDRIALLLRRAWWDRATVAMRREFGERP